METRLLTAGIVVLALVLTGADIADKDAKVKAFIGKMRAEQVAKAEKLKLHLRAYNSDTTRAEKGKIDRTQKELVRTTGKGEYRYKTDQARRDYLQERATKSEEIRGDIVERLEGKLDEADAPRLQMPFQVGLIGRLQAGGGDVTQVIDKSRCLFSTRAIDPGSGQKLDATSVILRGVSTDGIVDNTYIGLTGVFVVAGTTSYQSLGGQRTVFVIEPVDLNPQPLGK